MEKTNDKVNKNKKIFLFIIAPPPSEIELVN